MTFFIFVYRLAQLAAAAIVHCVMMSVNLIMMSCGSLPKSWKYFWPFVSAGLGRGESGLRLLKQDGGTFVKKSGSGDMATFAPLLCCWLAKCAQILKARYCVCGRVLCGGLW
jgi:hypothetical protein